MKESTKLNDKDLKLIKVQRKILCQHKESTKVKWDKLEKITKSKMYELVGKAEIHRRRRSDEKKITPSYDHHNKEQRTKMKETSKPKKQRDVKQPMMTNDDQHLGGDCCEPVLLYFKCRSFIYVVGHILCNRLLVIMACMFNFMF